jgi:hypothetical protein
LSANASPQSELLEETNKMAQADNTPIEWIEMSLPQRGHVVLVVLHGSFSVYHAVNADKRTSLYHLYYFLAHCVYPERKMPG